MTNYYSLENLPLLSSDRRVKQVSSFDRKEQNGDFGQFLYTESNGDAVLFDEKNAGCIKSMWFAVTSDEAELSFYFDGESTPRYTVPLKTFIKNGVGDIKGCGVTYEERGQWTGGDCYCGNIFVPIEYKSSLKIVSRGKNDFYYHILYETYGINPPKAPTYHLESTFVNSFGKIMPERKEANYIKEITLEKQYTSVYDIKQAGVIREFTVEVDADADISDIEADIAFDGDSISYVACPLSHLFAEPCGFNGISTIAAESRKEGDRIIYSCYLPMLFWESCNITLVNMPKKKVSMTVKLRVESNLYDRNNAGYFHADFKKGSTSLFQDWILGEFHGRGNVVGIVQTCKGGQWCEGNEHFYIDGELSPSINGTGTEDLYLGCYWPNVKYDSPVAGCVKNIMDESGEIEPCFDRTAGYYRFFHDIPISFENGIKLAIQHGAVGQTYSEYSSCVFSYRQELSGTVQTDFLKVASKASADIHSYRTTNSKPVSLISKVEGDRIAPTLSESGFEHSSAEVEFKVSILKENNGAILRLLTDLSGKKRSAEVYVDGCFAGTLYDSEHNPYSSFGDTDFSIPKELTASKEILNIKLIGTFTDFEYKVFSKIK